MAYKMPRQGSAIAIAFRIIILENRRSSIYTLTHDPDGFIGGVSGATETSFVLL
jgi:hypothetical protein